jgi:hypothetical protein
MPQQRCLKAIANACTHRGCRAELQLRSLAAYHPMRCWQHLSDGATAWSRTNDSDVRAHMSRALGRLAFACQCAGWKRSQMHACTTVAAGQGCSFACSRLRHPMQCWQHLSDGATAWSRANDATSACRCRAHFCGLLLCIAAKAVANARMRRGCRAELPLACSCVTRAVLAASERWCNLLLEPRKRCDVRAYTLRTNVQAESDRKCTHAPWLPGRAAASLARGCVTRCGAGSI